MAAEKQAAACRRGGAGGCGWDMLRREDSRWKGGGTRRHVEHWERLDYYYVMKLLSTPRLHG
jgi:hypothetical protein